MPVYIAEYTADVQALTCEQDGAYWRLLRAMWRAHGSLPNDQKKLALIVGLSDERWAEIGGDVLDLFKVQGSSIKHLRLLAEFERAERKSSARKAAGKKGGETKARKINGEGGSKTPSENVAEPYHSLDLDIDKKDKKEASEVGGNPPGKPNGGEAGKGYPVEFEEAWKAYPHVKGRSSKPNALAQWRKLPADERSRLVPAVEAFAAKVDQVCGGMGAPCMGRWLRDGKHQGWLTDDAPGGLFGRDEPEEGPDAPVAELRRRLGLWKNHEGYWREEWGPRPRHRDCMIDPALLAEFGIKPPTVHPDETH